MIKNDRLQAIKDIIEKNEVSNQEELTNLLNQNGYNVSQATVSRDINDLKLIKVSGQDKKVKYVLPKLDNNISNDIIELFKRITISINYANNLIVIKTLSGNGSSAGMTIDKMNLDGILGSIAGDDTLLVIAKTESQAQIIVKMLKDI